MISVSPRQPYIKRSISFPRPQLDGLRIAAAEDGHHNVSRLIQDLVEAELRRRYGRDWSGELPNGKEEAA
jgi:hypothetical protein